MKRTSFRYFAALGSLAASLSVFPAGCGGDPSIVGSACNREGLANACGAACETSATCEAGLYCGPDDTCIADCIAGEEDDACEGQVCNANGSCPGSGDLDSLDLDEGGGSGTDGEGCIDADVDFSQQIPNVLLLIDRSGSMNGGGGFDDAVEDAVDAGDYILGNCPGNNDWRWNVVRDVLFHPERGVVPPLQDKVRFGLSLYTSLDGDLGDDECPMMTNVPMAIDNYDAMLEEFRCSDYTNNGDTPTGPAILEAAQLLAAYDQPGPKVIVLATDGEPDDCSCPDFGGDVVPDECLEDGAADRVKADVVEIAAQVAEMGIELHVINVSSPGNASLQEHLADVADAGGGEVYPGFDPSAIVDAFDQIINGARSCKIDLDGSIAAGEEDSGRVTLDGETLEFGEDYRVNNASQIELLGDACDTIKDGDHVLGIDFPCGSFVPPTPR